MKQCLILLCILCIGFTAKAQQSSDIKKDTTKVFTEVENLPKFPGGEDALYAYLSKNIKYPLLAMERGIQGKVYTSFIIEADGSITNIKILRGIGGGCDEEAIRVIHSMPKWIPGRHNNKNVRVEYTLPINYQLR